MTKRVARIDCVVRDEYGFAVKVGDVIRMLQQDGWFLARTRGVTDNTSMRQNPAWTVPGKLGDELAPGTFNSVLKQAELKK
jgi:predicted RNA binding protein YcfA (HicA-like mRNA interferase family)